MGLVDYRREYNLWLDLIHNFVSMVIDPRPSTPSETSNTDPKLHVQIEYCSSNVLNIMFSYNDHWNLLT